MSVGAFRAAQHLDALNVVEVQIRCAARAAAHRLLVEVVAGCGVVGAEDVRNAAVGNAADVHELGARPSADVGDRGRLVGEILETVEVEAV